MFSSRLGDDTGWEGELSLWRRPADSSPSFWLLGKILCLGDRFPSTSSKGSQAVACRSCLGDFHALFELWLSLFNFALQKTILICQKYRSWL